MGDDDFAYRAPRAAVQVEDGDRSRFGGDVKTCETRIEGKDVRSISDRKRGHHRHRWEIDNQQCGVILAGHKGQPRRRVDEKTVWPLTVLAEVIASDNSIRRRGDCDELVR